MAKDSIRWDLRPAWRLAIAIGAGLTLTVIALAWPAMVWGVSPPDIIQVQVSSSKSTFFYSPPLTDSGGTIHFNNLSGEGAGQIITVTVTISDDNPTAFSGGSAFGITPTTNISTPYVTTSTWSVTYTIQAADTSENGVLFTIIDGDSLTDTVAITFTQDVTDPEIGFVDVTDPQYDPDGNELNTIDNWYRTTLLDAGWSFTASITETGAGHDGGTAFWDSVGTMYDQAIFTNDGRGTFTPVVTNPDGLVAVSLCITDRVGNVGTASVFPRLDSMPPFAPPISYLADTDSGGDGFDPHPGYYDDPSIDVTWSAASDPGGSGVAGYYLDTESPPGTSLFYPGTTGVVTVTGNFSETFNYIYITAVDNVGNVGSDLGYIENTSFLFVRLGYPRGGDVDIWEDVGGEYLYISDPTQITEGTLFYNNTQTSTFTVEADTSFPFNWGDLVPKWKVVFTPGWGEVTAEELFAAPYTHTYSITPSEVTNVFTVYFVNKAGNVQSVVIDAVDDTQAPQVAFTDVTDPDYDPDLNELNTTDNWYRTSGLGAGWSFTTDITDTLSGIFQSYAYWNHSVVTNSQSIPAPGGDGTFFNIHDDSDGTVQVTVAVTDHVNNAGGATLEIQLDGTPPGINANPWTESSAYLSRQGDVLYFNAAMPVTQTATVSGTTADGAGAGLDYVAFEQKANLPSAPVTQTTTGNWSSDYGFTSATGVGPGSVQVTVYDHVGNLMPHTYEYMGVSDQPSVAFDNVTAPGYDVPPNDPLDGIGNWYAEIHLDEFPGNGWAFHAIVTPANNIDIVAAMATWEHQAGSLYGQVIYPTPGSGSVQGTFENVRDDPSGLVTVTLTITDDLNRVATDTLLIRLDKEGPAIINNGWTESSEYLHADGSTLYFSHLMGTTQQTATLIGHVDDGPSGAGAQAVTFSAPESLGPSTPNPGEPDWSIEYLVSNTSTDSGSPVQVTVEDNLENQTIRTYPYVLDTTPPATPTITSPAPGYTNTQSLNVSWISSTDNITGAGLLGYYLGDSNPPTTFYSPLSTTTTFDTGADGTFTLYLMAKDNVGNTSLASSGPITIDTRAPVAWVTATPDESQNRILVEWGANDPSPGTWPVAYDVEYRVRTTGTWQVWFTNTPTTSAYFGPDTPIQIELETPYYFRARARDYVGNQSNWSSEASGGLGLKQTFLPLLAKNFDFAFPYAIFDGFEAGAFLGWKTGGALPRSIVTSPLPPNGGSYAALLGSPSFGCHEGPGTPPYVPVGQAYIQAYAYVPAGGTPYLRFDYRVLSYDTVRSSGGVWWDRLEVQINGARLPDDNGSGLGDSNPYGDPDVGNFSCSNLYDSGWQDGKISLSAYAGQTVILTFFNENHGDGYWNTYSYLDNIRIEVVP